jgi:hypothetical protein
LAIVCLAFPGALVPDGAAADTASYASTVLSNQPSAYYRFLEPAGGSSFADSSGHGNTATAQQGAVQIDPTGPVGGGSQAVALSGGVYVQAPALAAMQGDNSRTVELWLKTSAPTDQCMLSSGTASHAASFSLCLTDGKQYGAPPPGTAGIYLQTYDADVYIPGLQLMDGAWHYVAVALSGSTVSIVVDGQTPSGFIWNGQAYSGLVSQPFVLPSTPNTAASAIGIGETGWATTFDGSIGEVAIYPSTLSPSQLSADYTAGISTSSGKIPTNQTPPMILGSPVEGETLTELNGIWDDFFATLQDQWLRCDAVDSSHCAVIPGATGLTYVPTALDVGYTLEVQETASNAAGKSAAVNSSPTSVVRTSLGGCVAGAMAASVARAASHASAHRLPVATASRAGRRTRPRRHRRVPVVHDVVFARGHDQIVVPPGKTLASAYYHFEVPASQPFAHMPQVHLDPIEIDSRSRRIFLRFSAPGGCNVILTGVFRAARLRFSARRRTFSLSLSAPLTTLANGTPSGSFVYHVNGRVGRHVARAASNSGGAGGVSLSPSGVLDVYANVLSVAGGKGKIASATATLPAVEKGGGGQAATNPEQPVGSTYKGQTGDLLSISFELTDNKSAIKHVDVSMPEIPCSGTIVPWAVLAGDVSTDVGGYIDTSGNMFASGGGTTLAGTGLPGGYYYLSVTGHFSPSAVVRGVTVQQIQGSYAYISFPLIVPIAGSQCPHTANFMASVAVTSQ